MQRTQQIGTNDVVSTPPRRAHWPMTTLAASATVDLTAAAPSRRSSMLVMRSVNARREVAFYQMRATIPPT